MPFGKCGARTREELLTGKDEAQNTDVKLRLNSSRTWDNRKFQKMRNEDAKGCWSQEANADRMLSGRRCGLAAQKGQEGTTYPSGRRADQPRVCHTASQNTSVTS